MGALSLFEVLAQQDQPLGILFFLAYERVFGIHLLWAIPKRSPENQQIPPKPENQPNATKILE